MSRSDADTNLLGMSWGTANNRLRKMVLFSLIQRCGEDFCIRCGSQIESIDDLSIEHIKPWRGNNVELFWDLDNIAFSHVQCNRPHIQRGSKRVSAPEGQWWCSGCAKYKPIEEFGKSSARYNGIHCYCKSCVSVKNKNRVR